jgi:hypothetical protein
MCDLVIFYSPTIAGKWSLLLYINILASGLYLTILGILKVKNVKINSFMMFNSCVYTICTLSFFI